MEAVALADKAAELAKVSAKGGFHLFWGIAVSTFVSAIGMIILARIMQPQNYGLYTIALAAPNLIGTFRDWGMNSAMIKYTAQFSAEKKPEQARNILLAGLVFEVVLGLALSFVSFFLSGFVASDVFKRPIAALIQISSFTILAGAFLNAAQATFVGKEHMKPNSITLVLQALFRAVLSPLLVYFGFGVSGAVVGYTVGVLGGGLVGVIFMLEIYRSLKEKKSFTERLKIWKTMRFMFHYAVPLSFSSIFGSFLAQFYIFILAIYASNFLIGNYAVANNFIIILTFFSTPITTMLFPAFSKLTADKDKETIKIVFESSIKYSSLVIVPACTALIILAGPIVSALFGERYGSAPLFLALLSVTYLLTAFGWLSTNGLISGQGKTGFYLKLAIVNMITGISLAVLLVPTFKVIGLIITTIFDGVPGLVISLYWIKKHYDSSVDWVSSAKILGSAAFSGTIAYIVISFVSLGDWPRIIIGLSVFAVGFLLSVIATGALKKSDIDSIRLVTSELGPISIVVKKILSVLEKLMSLASS